MRRAEGALVASSALGLSAGATREQRGFWLHWSLCFSSISFQTKGSEDDLLECLHPGPHP
jgi:hypothetical protein